MYREGSPWGPNNPDTELLGWVFCLVLFPVMCVQNSKYSNKSNKHDLEIASAFASNQPHLVITVVLSSVELKSEAYRLLKQGAEGSKKAAH